MKVFRLIWLFIIALINTQYDQGIFIKGTEQEFSALFAFGDSLTDHGNNNFLESLAKANYAPYGVDFDQGIATGRFCNGRTIIDFLGELLGFPRIPPYLSTTETNIIKGVNYASAAGGILDETGRNLGQRFSLSGQVDNFKKTVDQLRTIMGEQGMANYLPKSLVIMTIGSNDYINNYLQPLFYTTSYTYTPTHYADLLIELYKKQVMELNSLGLRKFLLAGIGPLGCVPNQLATGHVQPGECASYANDIVKIFNTRLTTLATQLNADYNGSIFVYGNTYGAVMEIIDNATQYGINVTDRACCGIGRNEGQITCLPMAMPCTNRSQYAFWDAFHPTQVVNQILARKAYSGPSTDCYPINIQQMAKL